jgi:hypothetical protein
LTVSLESFLGEREIPLGDIPDLVHICAHVAMNEHTRKENSEGMNSFERNGLPKPPLAKAWRQRCFCDDIDVLPQ